MVHDSALQAVVFWGGLFGMITVPVFTAAFSALSDRA